MKPILASLFAIAWLVSPRLVLSAIALEAPSLRNAAAGRFEIGVGISDHIPQRTNDWPLLTAQFSTVMPENCMKPATVQPTEGTFDFATADAFVDFATRQKLKLVGHCLVWAKDERTFAWFYCEGQQSANREHGLNPPSSILAFKGRSDAWLCVRGRIAELTLDIATGVRPGLQAESIEPWNSV